MILVITSMIICVSGSLPSQYVLINKSAELTDYIGQYTESFSGKTFLVVDMTIENHGYDSVEINPNYFGVVIDKVAYPYDKATFSTESPLTSSALLDGGKTSGKLVFQIPEDKTEYVLVFAGQREEKVIYGNLAHPETQKKSEPEKPSRSVTYKLAGKPQTLTAYGELTSNPGYLTLTTKSERSISSGEPQSFVEITIKTAIDKSLKPLNEDKEIQKASDSNMDNIEAISNEANFDTKPTYEATLANGDKVTVHPFKNVHFAYNGNYIFASYLLDSSTIVTISSTENKLEFNEVLKSLKIGELQNSNF